MFLSKTHKRQHNRKIMIILVTLFILTLACGTVSRAGYEITSPHDGDVFRRGEPITFSCNFKDTGEGAGTGAYDIFWESDKAGIFEQKSDQFTTSELEPGTHEITCSNLDENDNKYSARSITITILDETMDESAIDELDTTGDAPSTGAFSDGFDESDCVCSDLPVDSAIAGPTRLGCQYQWLFWSRDEESVLNRASLSILYSEDSERLQNEFDTHYGLVAVNVPEIPIQWEHDETHFIFIQKQEQTLEAFPFKYYGDVGMFYATNFVINISLGGSGFSGEAELNIILQDLINCATTLIDQ